MITPCSTGFLLCNSMTLRAQGDKISNLIRFFSRVAFSARGNVMHLGLIQFNATSLATPICPFQDNPSGCLPSHKEQFFTYRATTPTGMLFPMQPVFCPPQRGTAMAAKHAGSCSIGWRSIEKRSAPIASQADLAIAFLGTMGNGTCQGTEPRIIRSINNEGP